MTKWTVRALSLMAILFAPLAAQAQGVGQLGSGQIWGNSTAARAPAAPTTITSIFDRAISSTQGALFTRNATTWIGLAPGTAGLPLVSQGAAANLAYAILGLSGGGCNAALTASNGGVLYSTASACAILSGTATARQMLQSGASGAPAWSTTTWPATTTINRVLFSSAANVIGEISTVNGALLNTNSSGVPAMTATPVLGINGGTGGQITLNGSTSGSVALRVAAAAGTSTVFQFPATNGSNTNVLQTDGNGNTSWVTAGAVTSVTAGSGLSGGTITTTGTVAMLFDPGSITNCTLTGTVLGNALTVALKQQDGSSDPTSTAPCVVSFRSATIATGTYTAVLVTAATSFVTGTTGSTFGSTNAIPFRLWITAWNNAGTVVLGVSSQSTATAVFPLNEGGIASSTACNACTNASAAGTFYTTAAQTSKAFRILGYMDWGSGLATAGTWASGPTTIQMFGPGIKKPGEVVQTVRSATGAVATGTTVLPVDDTIPQNTEGNQYLTQAITPTSTVNLLDVSYQAMVAASAGSQIASALFQDSTVNALVASATENAGSNQPFILTGRYVAVASTVSSTTFNVRAGPGSAATVTFNGVSGGRLFGGVNNSFIEIREIMG